MQGSIRDRLQAWFLFLLCAGANTIVLHDPSILRKASLLTADSETVLLVLSVLVAGILLDRKPSLRARLAKACILFAIPLTLMLLFASGILLDMVLMVWMAVFGPIWVECIFAFREKTQTWFFTSCTLVSMAGMLLKSVCVSLNLLEVLLVPGTLLCLIMLLLLLRGYENREASAYSMKAYADFARQWKHVLPFAFVMIFLTYQISNIYFEVVVTRQTELYRSLWYVFYGSLFLIFGILLDVKGGLLLYKLSTVLYSIGLLVVLIPVTPTVDSLLIPLHDIGSMGYTVLLLMFPFVLLPKTKGYLHCSLGYIANSVFAILPNLIPWNLAGEQSGRWIVTFTIVFSLGLMFWILTRVNEERKKEMECELQAAHAAYETAMAKAEAAATVAAREPDLSTYMLSSRETQVAMLLLQAKNRDQIASELFLSRGTINTYCSSIFKKVGCSSQAELIAKLTEDYIDVYTSMKLGAGKQENASSYLN